MNLKMVPSIMDNGKTEFVVEKENKFGMTDLYMKGNGQMVWPMEKEGLFIQMAMYILEIGKMIKHMDKEYTLTWKEHNILEHG